MPVDTDLEDPYDSDGLEIVDQSELDNFVTIMQKAQKIAAQVEREKSRKRPRTYDGKSKRTLKRHKKHREDLAKQGFLPVFHFIALTKEQAEQRAINEQPVERATESEQVSRMTQTSADKPEGTRSDSGLCTQAFDESEESESEEIDTEDLVSKRADQVRHRKLRNKFDA
jgi:hypothetical protein